MTIGETGSCVCYVFWVFLNFLLFISSFDLFLSIESLISCPGIKIKTNEIDKDNNENEIII